jgi:membrane protein
LYFYGPSRSENKKFVSAGSSLATLLIVITSLGFNYFIVNFAQYNKVYGSIGTLIIILVWLFINSLVLLIGFELNVAIQKAGKGKSIPLSSL